MAVYHETIVTASAGTGQSGGMAWVPLNVHQNPFSTSFFINRITGGGDATCRVEHTHRNVLAEASVPTNAIFRHEDASAVLVSGDGNYAYPVQAIRLWVTPASGQATFRFNVIQGDGK
jgi:hypothetical protein